MPLDRPFIDSEARIGRPKRVSKCFTNSKKPFENRIRFQKYSKTHLQLLIPERSPILVTKRNAIKLAHWLLDVSTEK